METVIDLKVFERRTEVPKDFTGTCFIKNLKQTWVFLNGQAHSDEGCAVTSECGTQKWWFKHDKLHRLDGPAAIIGGQKYWNIEGVRLEEHDFNKHPLVVAEKQKTMNKTAEKILLVKTAKQIPEDYTGIVRYPSGLTQKLHKGQKHCFYGPAVRFANGTEEWWIDGLCLIPSTQPDLISFLKSGKKINFIKPTVGEQYHDEEYPFEEMEDGWNYSSYDQSFFFVVNGKPCNPDGDAGKYYIRETEVEFWDEEHGEYLTKSKNDLRLKQKKFAREKGLDWIKSQDELSNSFSGTIMIGSFEVVFQNGKRHCETGPACIEYDSDLNVVEKFYWLEGKRYASQKTWEIKLAKLKKEKEVAEALNSPLVKLRVLASRLAGAHDRILTKDDKIPTDGRSIFIDEQNKKVVVRNYVNGNYHSLTVAAYIEYSPDGERITELYSVNGKHYETGSEWLEAVEAYKATADRAKEKTNITQQISVKLESVECAKELSETLARRGFAHKETDAYVSEVKKQREEEVQKIQEKIKKEQQEIIARYAINEYEPKTKEKLDSATDSKVIPVIKSDLSQAGKRLVAKQIFKLAKSYIVKSLSKGNNKAEANLNRFFATNQGLILLNGMMAVTLPVVETFIPENWKELYKEICREYRVETMASGGELLLDAVFASNLSSLKEETEEVFEKLRVDISEEAKASESEEVSVVASSPGGEINLSLN